MRGIERSEGSNNLKIRGLLELRCNLIAYDTKTLVGANGRSPRRQRFRNFINSAYHPNSTRPKIREF